jgi:cob(I)alamin adenosyltransferase
LVLIVGFITNIKNHQTPMAEDFKIYTKTGDAGDTSLIGGTRVRKDHIRIAAYGDVDELKSFVGLLRDQEINLTHKRLLLEIQDRLFTLESQLAAPDEAMQQNLPQLNENDVLRLEKAIDHMNESLPPITSFILPGGFLPASWCHVCRTICRRAERSIITLAAAETVDPLLIRYVNRLSDYLFVLARMLTQEGGGVETPWIPKR